MKTFIFAFIIAATIAIGIHLSPPATAQSNGNPNANPTSPNFAIAAHAAPYPELEQHGNLVDIRMVPGDKETRFYVVGKDAAKLHKLSLTGKVKSGDKETELKLRQMNEYFVTEDKVEGQSLHLKAHMEDIEKEEEFHINLRKH